MDENEGKVEVEVEVTEDKKAGRSAGETVGKVITTAGESVGKAINSFVDTLEVALAGRGNTVMVRVNDEALEKLDMLVTSGICSSRSESAAFLLQRGIEGSEALFSRISQVSDQITSLQKDLQDWVREGK